MTPRCHLRHLFPLKNDYTENKTHSALNSLRRIRPRARSQLVIKIVPPTSCAFRSAVSPRFSQPCFLYQACFEAIKGKRSSLMSFYRLKLGKIEGDVFFRLNRCGKTNDVRYMCDKRDKNRERMSKGKHCSSQQRNH